MLGDPTVTLSLGVSEGGQTLDSDAQDQRQVFSRLLDLRPQGVPVLLEDHVAGGKQTLGLVVLVVRQVHAAQRHLPLPRHALHLAQEGGA